MKICFLLLQVLLFATNIQAQRCFVRGQTPATAFPVCGTDTFIQNQVPLCNNGIIAVPGCAGTGVVYQDKNPFWYRFTCYETGTLGFIIDPLQVNDNDDYDWQLFDITGRNPDDVYNNASLFVSGNWAGTYNKTGAGTNGDNRVECASDPRNNVNTFSTMPIIVQGHEYLLMISHFLDQQIGYELYFTGGTASITDPLQPIPVTAYTKCDGTTINLKLNKLIQCETIDRNGSCFEIYPPVANIISASGTGCTSNFGTDTVSILLDQTLPAGNYTIKARIGADGNSLIDFCNNVMDTAIDVPMIFTGVQPTPMDSLTPPGCAPDTLYIPFRNAILCNSIAADGSDFVLSGTGNETVKGAAGAGCTGNGTTTVIKVWLSSPIQTAGTYTLQLSQGGDGNAIIDECSQETPAVYSLPFNTADTVNADFLINLVPGCKIDTLVYAHDGLHDVNTWYWIFDTAGSSASQTGRFLFKNDGNKKISLQVNNELCEDTASVSFLLNNDVIASAGIMPSLELCPEDIAIFTDSSKVNIHYWYWSFGDGTTSNSQYPPPKKYPPAKTSIGTVYPVSLVVGNDINCFDTTRFLVKSLYNCYIDVPTAFTPNGDGLNDYFYPLNAYKADNLIFRVYNRYGQLIFETKEWSHQWNGAINGTAQPSGTYIWTLQYTHKDTNRFNSTKGTVVLIR